MLIRILSRATRAELYRMGTYCSADMGMARNTTWGLYGPDGAFKRMMTTLRNDPRIRAEGGYIMCTQRVLDTPLGKVIQARHTEFYL